MLNGFVQINILTLKVKRGDLDSLKWVYSEKGSFIKTAAEFGRLDRRNGRVWTIKSQ
jgi:hypothetical protein